MCNSLGISRPSLREALRSLEAEKLIEITPNRGPQVATLTWSDAKAIYDVRGLLEGEAAALAAEGSSDKDVAIMSSSLAAFARAAKKSDHEGQLEATAKFYDTLLQSAGNKVIAEILSQLSARITWLRRRSMSLPGRALQSAGEMGAILEAIERRDAKSARATAKRHVELASKAAARAYSLMESEV
jgi:DNA-binding GntR family transcriptional regulator